MKYVIALFILIQFASCQKKNENPDSVISRGGYFTQTTHYDYKKVDGGIVIQNKLGETSVSYALIDRKCFNFSFYENSNITTDCKIVIDSSQMLFVLIKDGKASLQKDFKHPQCIINDTTIVKNLTTGRCIGF